MRILLHVCCGCCSTHCINELIKDYSVTLFFSNSNIDSKDEWENRLEQVKKMAEVHNLPLIIDNYDHDSWLEFVKGLESEPGGGLRCRKCFEFNLSMTDEYAKDYDFFTTTLTVSPHKNSALINEIGKKINFEKFLVKNFKKQDGFKKSLELSYNHRLYRQNYCGCEFSKRVESPKE